MGQKIPQLSRAELERRYHQITNLYQYAEALVDTVESKFTQGKMVQFELISPLVDQIGESTDILAEEFLYLAQGNHIPGKSHRKRVEAALRNIFLAIDNYKLQLQQAAHRMGRKVYNVADPVIERIKQHVTHIAMIFKDTLGLSLSVIMHKADLDQMRKQDAQVALALHDMALQHS